MWTIVYVGTTQLAQCVAARVHASLASTNFQPEDVITFNTIHWIMLAKERGYMVACMYHEACLKGVARPDDQGVHGLGSPCHHSQRQSPLV